MFGEGRIISIPFAEDKPILALLFMIFLLGTGFLFLGKRKLSELLALFNRVPRYGRISAIVGAVVFLPIGLGVGYLEIWLAGGGMCGLGEWISQRLTMAFTVRVLGGLSFLFLCSIGFFVGIPLGFLAGLVFVEVVGGALAMLIAFLVVRLRSILGYY